MRRGDTWAALLAEVWRRWLAAVGLGRPPAGAAGRGVRLRRLGAGGGRSSAPDYADTLLALLTAAHRGAPAATGDLAAHCRLLRPPPVAAPRPRARLGPAGPGAAVLSAIGVAIVHARPAPLPAATAEVPAHDANRLARPAVVVLLAATALAAGGCRRGPEFAVVEGVVTLDGRPLADVEVVFLPDPEKGNFGPHSTAYTDDHGRFRMRCERPEADGAAVGPLRVILRDLLILPGLGGPIGGTRRADPAAAEPAEKESRVPPAYALPHSDPRHRDQAWRADV